MPRFSANLGFLWRDQPLADATAAAKEAGFAAVECHWPYDTSASEVAAALDQMGMLMMSLNTRRGDPSKGEMGLAAVPEQQERAREHIEEAIEYAEKIDSACIHVMAGNVSGTEALRTFLSNLAYRCPLLARLRATTAGSWQRLEMTRTIDEW